MIYDIENCIVKMFITRRTICMQGITVICAKRGGDGRAKSHSEWLITVPDKPDAINFNFIPITSLLKDVPGSGLLSHAMSLYRRCNYSSCLILTTEMSSNTFGK